MRRTALAVALAGSLAACQLPVQQSPVVRIAAPYDAAAATVAMRPGTGLITGSALMRQRNGGVVSCAGRPVLLIPVTAYATERIIALYGNAQAGHLQNLQNMQNRPQFDPDVPEYRATNREVRCDAQGNFEFDALAPGEYYVTTAITWQVSAYGVEGGALMRRVRIDTGQRVRVVLAP